MGSRPPWTGPGCAGGPENWQKGAGPEGESWERGAHRPPARSSPHSAGPAPPRTPWPARQACVTTLRFLQERTKRLAQPPNQGSRARGPVWEQTALGVLSPPPLARDAKNMLNPISRHCHGLGPPGAPPVPSAPPQRRHRKQPHPCRGTEKADPGFEGVTLKFQIKPDSSLQILPSYSLACSSRALGSAVPAGVPEGDQGGSESLGPRRCASCKTQRTPLWRDAEDGTPLCNACGIRYKKYGTRCSACWLVPRKSVQPKRFCGRCGISLGPPQDAIQEGAPKGKTQASDPRAPQGEEGAQGPVSGDHRPPPPGPLLQSGLVGPPLRKCSPL